MNDIMGAVGGFNFEMDNVLSRLQAEPEEAEALAGEPVLVPASKRSDKKQGGR
jgi:hypothetical protein